jgi:hypothetical protein
MRRLVHAAVAGVLTSLLAVPVVAAPPEISTETVEETFPDEFLSEECGFPVTLTLSGMTRTRTWLDAEGNPTREVFTINLHGAITAGGQSLHFVDAGMDKVTFLEGGGVLVEVHGNLGLVTAKGRGPVLGGTGRFVFTDIPLFDDEGNPILDEEGNPVSEFTVLSESGLQVFDPDAACAALAPPA